MRFRKVVFKQHGIIGNLELNLINPKTDEPYKNIVFVGENGVGKTTMLYDLYEFCTKFCYSKHLYESVEYEHEGKVLLCKTEELEHDIVFRVTEAGTGKTYEDLDYEIKDTMPNSWYPNNSDIIMSSSITDFSKTDPFADTHKTLLEIQNKDVIEYTYYNIEHDETPMRWSEFYKKSRIHKFSNAFNHFFKDIKYFGLGFNRDGEKTIGFQKNGHKIGIHDLSSGEKYIIHRATSIFKNVKNIKNSIMFIDEPEMSLHPEWQTKIIQYYKDLFSDNDGVQQSQMFISSHSPYILKNALEDDDTIIFKLSIEDGLTRCQRIDRPRYLQRITFAEINFIVFGVSSPEYHNQLYCQLQLNQELSRVKQCDEYIIHRPQYNPHIHEKPSVNGNVTYNALSTFIRNAIDHYDNGNTFSNEELERSIILLQSLL